MHEIEALFEGLNREEKYQKIILLGRDLPPLDPALKTDDHLVPGCQSRLYLHTELLTDGTLLFQAESDALISAGLAALLIKAYSKKPPEIVLSEPPLFLKDLEIGTLLSPSRSNGLYSLHLRMKQDALKYCI